MSDRGGGTSSEHWGSQWDVGVCWQPYLAIARGTVIEYGVRYYWIRDRLRCWVRGSGRVRYTSHDAWTMRSSEPLQGCEYRGGSDIHEGRSSCMWIGRGQDIKLLEEKTKIRKLVGTQIRRGERMDGF
ncbi:hypothetical protein Tco_0421246 [Tanacetum coccineum]